MAAVGYADGVWVWAVPKPVGSGEGSGSAAVDRPPAVGRAERPVAAASAVRVRARVPVSVLLRPFSATVGRRSVRLKTVGQSETAR